VKPTTPISSIKRRRLKKRRERFVMVGGAVAVAALGGLLWATVRQSPASVPGVDSTVVAPDPQDSLYLAASGAATYARQRAAAAGATDLLLHPGDSLQAHAESLAAVGQKAEAAVLLTSAASLWQAAEQRTVPPPAALSTRPAAPTGKEVGRVAPVNPKPAVESPAASEQEPEVSDSLQIVRYYRTLESAIRTRQLSEIRALLPNLTDSEEKFWRNLFNEKNLTAVEAVYTIRSVTREGDGATARIQLDLTLTKKDKFEHRERGERTTLTLGQQGWRQVSAQRIQ
jgi:hypothetical protein